MKIKNNMRILMAKKGVDSIRQVSEGAKVHYGTLLNFYHQRFEVFNGRLIAALCTYFECNIEDLLELVEEKVS